MAYKINFVSFGSCLGSFSVKLNPEVAAARSAAVSPRLDVFFVVALLFACSNLVVAPSVCEYKVSYAS